MQNLKKYAAHITVVALLVGLLSVGVFRQKQSEPAHASSATQSYVFDNAYKYDYDSNNISIASNSATLSPFQSGPQYALPGERAMDGLRHFLTPLSSTRFVSSYGGVLDVDANLNISQSVLPNDFGHFTMMDALDSTHIATFKLDRGADTSGIPQSATTQVYTVDSGSLVSGLPLGHPYGYSSGNCYPSYQACSARSDLREIAALDATHFLTVSYSGFNGVVGMFVVNRDDLAPVNTSVSGGFFSSAMGTVRNPSVSILSSSPTAADFVISYTSDASIKAVVAHITIDDINGSTVAFGTPIDLGVGGYLGTLDTVTIDSTHFLLAYRDNDASPNQLYARVGTVTLDNDPTLSTISFGAPTASLGSPEEFLALEALDATHFALAFDPATGNTTYVQLDILSVSGDTITVDKSSTVFATNGSIRGLDMAILDADHIAFGVLDYSDNPSVAFVVDLTPTQLKSKLQPIAGIFERGIESWDSFLETAYKPANTEINYQLSSDDGATWQYWNGSAWTQDFDPEEGLTETDYNSASVINSNIGTFPIATGELLFRAFLMSSNGTSIPSLSNISIGHTRQNVLRILDSAYTSEYENFVPGDTLYFELRDIKSAGDGTQTITIRNTVNSDSESVLLTETGLNTGIFRGSLSSAAGASASDGILNGTLYDNLEAMATLASDGTIFENFENPPYATTSDMFPPYRLIYDTGKPYTLDGMSSFSSMSLQTNETQYLSVNNSSNATHGAVFYGNPIRHHTPNVFNFKDANLKLKLKVNDKSLLSSTGFDFFYHFHDFLISLNSGTGTSLYSKTFLTSVDFIDNTFVTFDIPRSDFDAILDWNHISLFYFLAATGDGTIGNAGFEFSVDDIGMGNAVYTDTTVQPDGIFFKDSSYSNSISTISLGDDAYLEFTRLASAGAGTASITLTTSEGDSENVILTEVGTSSGIFRGSIPTLSSYTPTDNNNTLEGIAAGTITMLSNITGAVIGDFDTLTTASLGLSSWLVTSSGATSIVSTPAVRNAIASGTGNFIETAIDGSINKEGIFYYYYPSITSPINFGSDGLHFSVWIDDPANLKSAFTGGAFPFNFANDVTVLAFNMSGSSPSAFAIKEIPSSSLTGGQWNDFTVIQSDFTNLMGAVDWSYVTLLISATTGDGVTGSNVVFGLDDIYVTGSSTGAIFGGTPPPPPIPPVTAQGLHLTNSSYVSLDDLGIDVSLGSTLYFRLNETSSAGDGTKDIQILSALGDTETITLTETGPSTGRFEGNIPTANSLTANDESGTLEAINNNILTAAVVIPGTSGSETIIDDFEGYLDTADLSSFSPPTDTRAWNQFIESNTPLTLEIDNTQYLKKIVSNQSTGTLLGTLSQNLTAEDMGQLSPLTATYVSDGLTPISVADVTNFIVPGYFTITDTEGSNTLMVRCGTKNPLNNQLSDCSSQSDFPNLASGTVLQRNRIPIVDMTNFIGNNNYNFYKIDNEWWQCTTYEYDSWDMTGFLANCSRAQRSTSMAAHTAGAQVILDDSNFNGFGAFPFAPLFAPVDMGDGDFSFEIKLSDPDNLNGTTGTDFGGLPSGLPAPFKNVTILLASGDCGGGPCAGAMYEIPANTFTANEWKTIQIPQSSFSVYDGIPLITTEWNDVRFFVVGVATGDGTTGNNMGVSIDNLKIINGPTSISFGASDTATATGATLSTGGGGSSSVGSTSCTSASPVEALQVNVVSQSARDVVDLEWNLPLKNRPDSLKVYRREEAQTRFNEVLWMNISSGSDLSNGTAFRFTDNSPSLFPDRIYTYAVIGQNSCGSSEAVLDTVTLPKIVPAGETFDLDLDIIVKTKQIRDDGFTEQIKNLLDSAKTEAKIQENISAQSTSNLSAQLVQDASADMLWQGITSLDPTSCSGASDWLRKLSPSEVAQESTLFIQTYKTHIDALIRKEFFCRAEADQKQVDLKVLYDEIYFVRESGFKYLSENYKRRMTFNPDWRNIDSILHLYYQNDNDRIGLLIHKAAEVFEASQSVLTTIRETSLLSTFDTSEINTYEDLSANETLKEAIISIPEIEKLVKGHQETFTLEIWPAGIRNEPVKTIEVTTDLFGHARIRIPNITVANYDFAIKKPYVIRKYLSNLYVNRYEMHLDFTRGYTRERDAYLKYGDLDGNGCIDANDLQEAFRIAGGKAETGDLSTIDQTIGDEDGAISLGDFLPIIQNWGCGN